MEKRRRFFGITNFVGNGAGVLGALAVPVVLARYTFPLGYVISFGLAAGLILLSWLFIAFTGFLTVYAAQRWQLADAQASDFTVALQVGLALANLFFGFFSDRKGHKLSQEICQGLNVPLLILAIFAPSAWWFFAVFALRGAVNAGMFVSGISIVYEFTDAESRPTYIGLANTLPGVAGSITPLVGVWLATALGYQTMFGVAAGFGVISWLLLHFVVVEPRRRATQLPQPAQ